MISNKNTNLNLSFHPPNPMVNPFTPRVVMGTLNTLMKKVFRYLQTVVSSTPQEGKIRKYSSVYRGSFSSARYPNYQQQKQTIRSPVARPEYGTVGINGLSKSVNE